MLRNISLIVAVIGLSYLLTPAVAQVNEGADSSQPKIDVFSSILFVIDKISKKDPSTEPCERGDDNRYSDLCAQWKAADASEESAAWTRNTFWVTTAGTVVGLLTFTAAVAASFYAKRAAEETKRANDILETVDRPWISIEVKHAGEKLRYRAPDNDFITQVAISLRNSGRSPALYYFFTIRENAEENLNLIAVPELPQFSSFHTNPFKKIALPDVPVRVEPLVENKMADVSGSRFPFSGEGSDIQFLTGRFTICVLYTAVGDQRIRWTLKPMTWVSQFPVHAENDKIPSEVDFQIFDGHADIFT